LGSTPDPAGGAYSAPPDLLAGFKGPTSKGRGWRGEEGEKRGVERRGEEGRERGPPKRSISSKFATTPLLHSRISQRATFASGYRNADHCEIRIFG